MPAPPTDAPATLWSIITTQSTEQQAVAQGGRLLPGRGAQGHWQGCARGYSSSTPLDHERRRLLSLAQGT